MTRPIRIMEGFASDEDEITFAITERGLQWKYHAKFSFGICFGKVGAIEGRDVRDNLDGMIRASRDDRRRNRSRIEAIGASYLIDFWRA